MLTETQERILAVLNPGEWLTPLEVARRLGFENATAGGCARSLRVLVAAGAAEIKQIGWYKKKYGLGLYAYRMGKRVR